MFIIFTVLILGLPVWFWIGTGAIAGLIVTLISIYQEQTPEWAHR